jgi:hypothetical protein
LEIRPLAGHPYAAVPWRSGFQPDHRSGAWKGTIIAQRQELERLVRNHAEAVLAGAYSKAVERVAAETGLPAETFPAPCPYTLDQLLSTGLLLE